MTRSPHPPVLAGTMQDQPLIISSLLRHAAMFNGAHEIISIDGTGTTLRYDYRQAEVRARRLARALEQIGIGEGDRIVSLAWNTHRHFELFYGVPGMGGVLHTINPRFRDDQIVYIANHGGGRVLFFDADLIDVVARIAPQLEHVEHYICLADAGDLPSDTGLPLRSYEQFLADDDYAWPELDESAAAILCYTSGTTGQPKGVLTSHRSTVIHALCAQSATAFGLTPLESVLLIVPMFHAYGWGIPFVNALSGAKLVLPGAAPDSSQLVDLIEAEDVTLAMGVPTVWTGILDHLDVHGGDISSLRRALIGGSAVPAPIARRLSERGADVVTGWGMTELSPLASFTGTTPAIEKLDAREREVVLRGRAGRMLYPIELKIVDANGARVPADGETSGDIWVRGPTVAGGYFDGAGGDVLDAEGWFPTGDIGTLDPHGTIAITDRFKDLIKSGGEWISSTDLEQAAAPVPGVGQVAAIAVSHPKWQERPLLLVVPSPGAEIDVDAIHAAMRDVLPRWQIPDDIVVIDELPLTATGKVDKKQLRQRFERHLLEAKAEEA